MKRIYQTVLAVGLLSASFGVSANNLHRNRALIEDSIEEVQSGYNVDFGLRRAEDNFTYVRNDIRNLRPSIDARELARSLDAAILTLRTSYSQLEKVRAVQSHGRDALRSIDRLLVSSPYPGPNYPDNPQHPYPGNSALDQDIEQLDRVTQILETGDSNRAHNLLQDVLNSLFAYNYDSDINAAIREGSELARDLRDPYISLLEKQRRARGSTGRMSAFIRQSRAYLDQGNGGGGYYPPTPDYPQPPHYPSPIHGEFLGQTQSFNNYLSTQTVFVNSFNDRFGEVYLRAEAGDLEVSEVLITLGNGRVHRFVGAYLRQGQALRIVLPGVADRRIRSIQISGRSLRGAFYGGYLSISAR